MSIRLGNILIAGNTSFGDHPSSEITSGFEVGDIGIAPLGIDESKGKRRYINGQLIIQDQYKVFTTKLKKAVSLYPSLACTEEEWQTIFTMTVGGQVGKFVIDDEAGTIRLPRLIMPIQGLTDLSKLGEIVEAGLPNIRGSLSQMWANSIASDGATIKTEEGTSTKPSKGSNNSYRVTLDASLSNPIYGNSETVQQEQIQYPYFIQVATGSETEDNIINEIELNNPYSLGDSKYSPVALNNLSWLKSEGQYNSKAVYPAYYDWALINANNNVEGFKFTTDEYTDYDVVINTTDETFRLPLLDGSESLIDYNSWQVLQNNLNTINIQRNGLLKVACKAGADHKFYNIIINGFFVKNRVAKVATDTEVTSVIVKKGDVVTFVTSMTGNAEVLFATATGNGSLYYYVGETIQNANLINAGRIEETLANKADKTEVDGGWVGIPSAIVAEDVTPSSTDDIVYDISNILPNDNYLYEVYLAGQIQTNGASGSIVSLIAGSSIIPSGVYVVLINTRTSSVVYSSGCAILPIGVDRTLFIGKTRNSTGKIINLEIVAYRRLGKTN